MDEVPAAASTSELCSAGERVQPSRRGWSPLRQGPAWWRLGALRRVQCPGEPAGFEDAGRRSGAGKTDTYFRPVV